jgi:hypothetical protein
LLVAARESADCVTTVNSRGRSPSRLRISNGVEGDLTTIPGYTPEQVTDHVWLMIQDGIVEGSDLTSSTYQKYLDG